MNKIYVNCESHEVNLQINWYMASFIYYKTVYTELAEGIQVQCLLCASVLIVTNCHVSPAKFYFSIL